MEESETLLQKALIYDELINDFELNRLLRSVKSDSFDSDNFKKG